MSNTELLQMAQISKRFDGTQVLREVNFCARAGEVHAIVGENGAGKSTLMKILAGAIPRDSGAIQLAGQPLDVSTPVHAQRSGIRAVYQEFSLVPQLSVTENILIGRMPTGRLRWWIDRAAAHRRAKQILEQLGFSGLDVRTPIARLGISQQQIVEIAKAVADRPRILILDEPSAVLSYEELQRLFALIHQLRQEGTLILYISHRLDEVFAIADRITVLKDGQVVGTVRPQEIEQADLIRMMVGRTLSEIYPPSASTPGPVLLEARDLTRTGAFSDVSFTLRSGEILGCFGLVGSGRTQMARCLFGAEPLSSGTIRLAGPSITPRSPREAVREGIALLVEDRKRDGLVLHCSIRDNASLATLSQLSRFGVLDRRRQDALTGAVVRELAIRPPQLGQPVRQLSGGNQQKVLLARWLLTQARVLILDEPTRGVDIATKIEIYQIMRNLARQGLGILLISSELPEILGMSDRILVMRAGRLAGEFTRATATEERLLAAAAGVEHA